VLGGVILFVSLLGVVGYFYLVFMSPWAWLVIQVSAFLAVAAVLVIVAWIGYTLATTPPPVPLEDLGIDFEGFDMDEGLGEDDSSSGEKAEPETEPIVEETQPEEKDDE